MANFLSNNNKNINSIESASLSTKQEQSISNICESVRTLRKSCKMTQTYLSKISGISATAISQIETCERTPHIVSLVKIFHSLGYDLSEVIEKGIAEVDKSSQKNT